MQKRLNNILESETNPKKQRLNLLHNTDFTSKDENLNCASESSKEEYDPAKDDQYRREYYYKPNERHLFADEVSFSQMCYRCYNKLNPIPFLKPQPEGMPCWLDSIDDIKKLNKKEVMVFLRGYEQSTDGTLDELKERLTHVVGVPKSFAAKIFGPPVMDDGLGDDTASEQEYDPAKDDQYRREYYYKPNERHLFADEVSFSQMYYRCYNKLSPIPFLKPQPEGMPCWLDSIDDIKKLNKKEVMVFLRGYEQSTDGTLGELKERLTCVVGVPKSFAAKVLRGK